MKHERFWKKINRLIFLAFSIFLFGCSCHEEQRSFFVNSTDTVFLASNAWWSMELKSGKCLNRLHFYKTNIQFPGDKNTYWSCFHNNSFIICDSKLINCDTLFSFRKDIVRDLGNVQTKLMFQEQGKYVFSEIRAGGRADFDYSNIRIWVITKTEGIISYGYYDQFNCLFEEFYGDTTFLNSKNQEICKELREKNIFIQ